MIGAGELPSRLSRGLSQLQDVLVFRHPLIDGRLATHARLAADWPGNDALIQGELCACFSGALLMRSPEVVSDGARGEVHIEMLQFDSR